MFYKKYAILVMMAILIVGLAACNMGSSPETTLGLQATKMISQLEQERDQLKETNELQRETIRELTNRAKLAKKRLEVKQILEPSQNVRDMENATKIAKKDAEVARTVLKKIQTELLTVTQERDRLTAELGQLKSKTDTTPPKAPTGLTAKDITAK
ncbi:MAG: hypothetical protein KAJ19_17955 [Gammaproteobacteria bacterium]|nr:hypothetical protein [Gammaproteobacteria bacterium]